MPDGRNKCLCRTHHPEQAARYTGGISAPTLPARPVPQLSTSASSRLYNKASDEEQDNEIERLKAMAAKLRAEAAELEAEKVNEMATAAEKAFNKFDLNNDGQISTTELKAGLEKALKMDLSDSRVAELMADFDKDEDGALRFWTNSSLSISFATDLKLLLAKKRDLRMKLPYQPNFKKKRLSHCRQD